MGKYNWDAVTRNHVIQAINKFLVENPKCPEARSTFLLYEGKKLPAKHIRGMAYKEAFQVEVPKSEYSGGSETERFFTKLGFQIQHIVKKEKQQAKPLTTEIINSDKEKKATSQNKKSELEQSTDFIKKISITSKKVIEQKNALQLILNRLFSGDVVCEKTFEWMKTPAFLDPQFARVIDAISAYRGDTKFAKKNMQLRCDFVCESHKLIIEYDERQHFTEARKASLKAYADVPLMYDRDLWMKACDDIKARDNQPTNRDEIRAYYDSVRDIQAYRNGYKLVRIMHGQIDFENKNSYDTLRTMFRQMNVLDEEVLSEIQFNVNDEKKPLRIGLYLQTEEFQNKTAFEMAICAVKKSGLDILVFPENCYTPFIEEIYDLDPYAADDFKIIRVKALELSRNAQCAVVISTMDKFGSNYSIFANDLAEIGETEISIYTKHTMTYCSAFQFSNYREADWFNIIYYKGYKIGLTICYDCNHAVFSRMYGLQHVDIILNSTGGDVVYDKWFKYNQARSIENSCYSFVTMGGSGFSEHPKCYVYGFSPSGKPLSPVPLKGGNIRNNLPGEIYVYTLNKNDLESVKDASLMQKETVNKKEHLFLPVGKIDTVLKGAEMIKKNLYLEKHDGKNIIYCLVHQNDIFKPEIVLPLLYAEELEAYQNKCFIIVNKFNQLSVEVFEQKLSVILKVRAMEDYCAVILESPEINRCYQTGNNRTAQVVKAVNGYYGIDLSRTACGDAIWKNKLGGLMQAAWRDNYEWLVHNMEMLAERSLSVSRV